MALFSNKQAIKQAKNASKQMQLASSYGLEASEAQTARNIAAEEAKANVFFSLGLGAPGSGTTGVSPEGGIFKTDATSSQALEKLGPYGGRKPLGTPREGVIDPEGYAAAAQKSPGFQIQDLKTRRALQLMQREGPEWDMLEQSTLGTIHEGAALQLRDTMRQLKNNYAKGGTARRAAMNEFQEIQAAESAMRMRTQETWQANLRLHDYIEQYADSVQAGNVSYVESLPGLTDSYRAAMQNSAALMVTAAEKAAIVAGNAYEIRASQKAVNFGTTLLEGAIMAALSEVGPAAGSYASSVLSGERSIPNDLNAASEYLKTNVFGMDPLQGPAPPPEAASPRSAPGVRATGLWT